MAKNSRISTLKSCKGKQRPKNGLKWPKKPKTPQNGLKNKMAQKWAKMA